MKYAVRLLDAVANVALYEFQPAPTPVRRRFFYAICAALACLALTVPDLRAGGAFQSATAFHVPNTWMHVGFRPTVAAELLGRLFLKPDAASTGSRVRALALLLTIPYLVMHGAWTVFVLAVVALGLAQMQGALAACFPVNTLLIFFTVCRDYWTHPVALCFWLGLAWAEQLHVAVPMVHTRHRLQTQSGKLFLLHNGGKPLITYARIADLAATAWGPLAWFAAPPTWWAVIPAALARGLAVWALQLHWNRWHKHTGFDIAKLWKRQGFKMKGWRDAGKRVDAIVRRNLKWNTIAQCVAGSVCDLFGLRASALWMTAGAVHQMRKVAAA
jgi:hypothetical protein